MSVFFFLMLQTITAKVQIKTEGSRASKMAERSAEEEEAGEGDRQVGTGVLISLGPYP